MIARQRITEAAAIRQYAAAQLLPNINAGKNFDATAVKRLMPTKVKIS